MGLPETPEELDEAARARGLVLDGPWPGARPEATSLAVQALSRGDVTLGSGEAPAGTTSIRHAAARLLQAGAPSDRVLACLTSVAATLAGRPERGAIEAGKVADLVLWSGDPLSLASRPLRAWVGGVLVFDDASNDGALTP